MDGEARAVGHFTPTRGPCLLMGGRVGSHIVGRLARAHSEFKSIERKERGGLTLTTRPSGHRAPAANLRQCHLG